MYEVDARGLSCPEPVILTVNALREHSGQIKIIVSEMIQKENIEKYAKSQGKKVCVIEKDSDFELIIE